MEIDAHRAPGLLISLWFSLHTELDMQTLSAGEDKANLMDKPALLYRH